MCSSFGGVYEEVSMRVKESMDLKSEETHPDVKGEEAVISVHGRHGDSAVLLRDGKTGESAYVND